MNIEELLERIEQTDLLLENHWVIKYKGFIIRTKSGKTAWKKKNHAKNALIAHLSHFIWYKEFKDLEFNSTKEIADFLLKEEVFTIEQLK